MNEGIEGVIGGKPCIGEMGAGGYVFIGPGNDIGPGPARDPVDEPAFPFDALLPVAIFGAVAVVDDPAAEEEDVEVFAMLADVEGAN